VGGGYKKKWLRVSYCVYAAHGTLTPIKEGDLAGFLVGHREGVLEPAVTFPQLISPPLLRLNALATDVLATSISPNDVGRGLEVIVIVVALFLGAPDGGSPLGHGPRTRARGGRCDGVEAVRARDRGGCAVRDVGRRERATAAPLASRRVIGDVFSAQTVESGRRNSVGGSERTRGGGRVVAGGGVRIVTEGVQVQGGKVRGGRRAGARDYVRVYMSI